MAKQQIRITLVRSLNKRLAAHKACASGLGLRKMHQSVVRDVTPENMGMVNKISYMLKVESV